MLLRGIIQISDEKFRDFFPLFYNSITIIRILFYKIYLLICRKPNSIITNERSLVMPNIFAEERKGDLGDLENVLLARYLIYDNQMSGARREARG